MSIARRIQSLRNLEKNIELLTTEIDSEDGETPKDLLTTCFILIRNDLKRDIEINANYWKGNRVKTDKLIEVYDNMITMVETFIDDNYKGYSKGYDKRVKNKYLTPLQELLIELKEKSSW